MKKNRKLTAFARLFVFAIFIAPLTYIVADYFISNTATETTEVVDPKYRLPYSLLIENPKQAKVFFGTAEELKTDLAIMEENLLDRYVGKINIKQQVAQSRAFHKQMMQDFDFYTGKELRRVKAVAKDLIRVLDEQNIPHPTYQFYIVNGAMANAFCSGSKLYFTKKMISAVCTTDDLLAAVISHELAHGYLLHTGSYFSRKSAARKLLGDNRVGDVIGDLYASLVHSPLSWADEACADLSGIKLMNLTNKYDPQAMADLFYLLSKKQEQEQDSYAKRLFVNSHPLHPQRISAITSALYYGSKNAAKNKTVKTH